MAKSYHNWLVDVRAALDSIKMPLDTWQKQWPFPFDREFEQGTNANDAAAKANRFWWHEQNKALKQDCRLAMDCWLPRGHQGECQPL